MAEFKYTPGPWVVENAKNRLLDKAKFENGAFLVIAEDCDHHAVADCSCNHSCRDELECEANAHLIAAAPELLEALNGMLRAFSPHPREDTEGWREEHEAYEAARAAIAKATGETK